MKPHLLRDNTEFPQAAQSLIPLVSIDPEARTVVIAASVSENMCGINVDSFLNNGVSQTSSPHPNPSVLETNTQNDVVPMKNWSDEWAEKTKQRSEEKLSTSNRDFSALGRKAARLLRKKKSEGHKVYSAQQEVARILEQPWTQIQYAVQLHKNRLNLRYERLRDRMIFKLWAEQGWTMTRIAERFNVHSKTISVWIKNIQSKKGNS